MKKCKDLADVFVNESLQETKYIQQLILIFDYYTSTSLKSQTRNKRTKGVATRFKIADGMNIVNMSLKVLLSHIETKKELKAYLCEKVVAALIEINKCYIVVYENSCETNISITPSLYFHEHEEADTLIILYNIERHVQPLFKNLLYVHLTQIFCCYCSFCTYTIFNTGRGNIGLACKTLGEEKYNSILGFHALAGRDQRVKFYGISKLRCWKVFYNSPPSVFFAFSKLGDISDDLDLIMDGIIQFSLNLYYK